MPDFLRYRSVVKVTGLSERQTVADVSKDRTVFMLGVKFFLTAWPKRRKYCEISKHQDPFPSRNSVASYELQIFILVIKQLDA